jgi:hypothetical protein
MSQKSNSETILAQDIDPNDVNDLPGPGQPISLAEIEDLLYGEEIPAEERLERLREFRDQMQDQESTDFGDNDAQSLMGEIDRAITRLSGATHEFEDPEDLAFDDAIAVDLDPVDHRETLAPDDDVLLDLEEADEESMEDDPDIDEDDGDEEDAV